VTGRAAFSTPPPCVMGPRATGRSAEHGFDSCGRSAEHGFTFSGRYAEHGFTLVELMVVLTVMALMAGAVVLTIGSRNGDVAETAGRFASRIAAARDEAIVGGHPVAVWITPSGYGFERYAAGRWQAYVQAVRGARLGPGAERERQRRAIARRLRHDRPARQRLDRGRRRRRPAHERPAGG